jgi:hypothetical protein
VTDPPVARPPTKTTLRDVTKKARFTSAVRRVRVIFTDDLSREHQELLSSDSKRYQDLLRAPNIDVKRAHSGKIVELRLISLDDQRSQPGERHGDSRRFTERIRNDAGQLIGSDTTLQFKPIHKMCDR